MVNTIKYFRGHVKEKFTYLESLQTTEENYIKSLLELKSILFDDDWYLALFRKLSETCKNILAGILALHQQKLEPVIKEGNENEIFKHFEIHLGVSRLRNSTSLLMISSKIFFFCV